jgi:hypothetical protein
MLENRLILRYNKYLATTAFSRYAEIPSACGETPRLEGREACGSPYGGFAFI